MHCPLERKWNTMAVNLQQELSENKQLQVRELHRGGGGIDHLII